MKALPSAEYEYEECMNRMLERELNLQKSLISHSNTQVHPFAFGMMAS
jgi:hypothetical protein